MSGVLGTLRCGILLPVTGDATSLLVFADLSDTAMRLWLSPQIYVKDQKQEQGL
jgi:hypothetical protein